MRERRYDLSIRVRSRRQKFFRTLTSVRLLLLLKSGFGRVTCGRQICRGEHAPRGYSVTARADHSVRSAVNGLTFVARRAGTQQATKAAMINASGASVNAQGSIGLTS